MSYTSMNQSLIAAGKAIKAQSFGILVANNLDDHETRLLAVEGSRWQGTWTAIGYSAGDLVAHGGNVYIATEATTGSDEPGVGSPNPWDLFVEGALGTLDQLQDVAIGSPLADGDVLTYRAASPAGWVNEQPSGAGLGSCEVWLSPLSNAPPSSSYATFNVRNTTPILEFDSSSAEVAVFPFLLPGNYQGGDLTVTVHWAAVPTSGTVGWLVAFERIGDSQQDLDADGFAADQTITATTVPATSGHVDKTSVTVTAGTATDSLAAGEMGRLRITRDVGNDTAAGDAQLVAVHIEEV